jgi:hypothetical protein
MRDGAARAPRLLSAGMSPRNRSVDYVDPCAEDIPCAALGTDVARFRRIALQLAPQPQYLRVNRAVVDVIAVQARHVQKLIARQNAIGAPRSTTSRLNSPLLSPTSCPAGALRRRVLRFSSQPSKR